VAITNVNLADKFGIHDTPWSTLFGAACLVIWLGVIPMAFWKARIKKSETLQKLGMVRYQITAQLFMIMLGTCVKVFLRLGFNVKYVMEWKGMINV
jgi:hypothetical protein